MKPVGMLMWEHRLIERVIGLFHEQVARIRETSRADMAFIGTAVDFIRTYADRTHHGKEEDILFRRLQGRDLPPHLGKIMEELINEHVYAREIVAGLVDAGNRYVGGEETLPEIVDRLNALAQFYPVHIVKEDRDFFHQSMGYLSAAEQQDMLREFEDFDRKMIHEKYRDIVEGLTGERVPWSPPGMVR
ncbi:MAG TPA: hemerythrin domain-containing protein [Deltaproteobacteria bacterium]|nr:hemerythrin domain-containing protein [Deltaproteobacteria bacterium]HOI06244.1 hemerythrin domain-containing protein [Deltaproteobacteria bacterium]